MSLKVLMLDLGETLVHDGVVLPHVAEALEAFAEMQTADEEPLATCLVSDFKMPVPPATPSKVAEIFEEYLGLLDEFGLREFFEPVERRATLSTHAGVNKPDRRVFEKALERLEVSAVLSECLFITENEAHLEACAALGMQTLHFGSAEGFTDWAEAPLLVAAKLAAAPAANMAGALGMWLRVKHGMQLLEVEAAPRGGIARAKVKTPCLLPSGELGGQQLHVELPAVMECRFDDDGRVSLMAPAAPSEEAVSEAVHFVKTLKAHGQIAPEEGKLTPGATHQLVTDSDGRAVLKRRRFSAI